MFEPSIRVVARSEGDLVVNGAGGPWGWITDSSLQVLLAISLTSVVLRSLWLGDKSLWIDEIWSIGISRMPWKTFLWVMRNQDPNTSLYYAFLHVWMYLGDGAFAVRAMSVLLAVATIPALYVLGNRLFGKPVGLIASAFLTVNAFHIQWSQEARGYSLVVLMVTVSSLLFVMCIEQPSRRNWALYILVSVLAVYAHLYATLVIGSHFISLLWLRRHQVSWTGVFGSAGLIGIFTVPLVVLFSARAKDPFVPLGWLPKATYHAVYDVFYSLAGNAEFPGSHGGKSILVAYFVVCAIGVLSVFANRHSAEDSFTRWHVGLLLCWLLLPIASIVAISVVQPMMMSRYLLICIPAITLLASKGILSIQPKWISILVFVTIVGLGVQRLPQYFHARAAFLEWRSVTDRLLSESRPGDGVIFCVAPGRLLFDYYRAKYHPGADDYLDIVYPQFRDERRDPNALNYLPPISGSFVESAAAHHDRIWLVVYHDHFDLTREVARQIKDHLSLTLHKSEERRINGVTLLLYSRVPD
jgi:mannosyltransferase